MKHLQRMIRSICGTGTGVPLLVEVYNGKLYVYGDESCMECSGEVCRFGLRLDGEGEKDSEGIREITIYDFDRKDTVADIMNVSRESKREWTRRDIHDWKPEVVLTREGIKRCANLLIGEGEGSVLFNNGEVSRERKIYGERVLEKIKLSKETYEDGGEASIVKIHGKLLRFGEMMGGMIRLASKDDWLGMTGGYGYLCIKKPFLKTYENLASRFSV
jgi:hypothetical protein